MTSLVKHGLRLARDVANVSASLIAGRKLFTVNQKKHWQERADHWLSEVEAVAQDPYYVELDRHLITTLAGLRNSNRFLEVGCFFGYRLAQVQAVLSEKLVVGLDVVFDALRLALETGGGLVASRLVNGDAIRLPFRSDAVDCVYTVACLTHIPERLVGVALDEIVRVTRRYLVLIEVYDRLMRLSKRIQVRRWVGGYCHPYEELLNRHCLCRIRVEGLYDSAGHPRYTLFVYSKEIG